MATTMQFSNVRPSDNLSVYMYSGFTHQPQGFGNFQEQQQPQPLCTPEAPFPSDRMEVDVSGQVSNNETVVTRKRKAESQVNERLCKRVGLLNIENGGERLYVPVESPSTSPSHANLSRTSTNPTLHVPPNMEVLEQRMSLEDTRHKVYIHDLDAELSESDSESEAGRLLLVPDIEKHLKATRIPKAILQPDDKNMYAGKDVGEMQLVVYGAPKSLTVPDNEDNVRRAIIEARRRAREEGDRVQQRVREAQRKISEKYHSPVNDTLDGMGVGGMAVNGSGFAPSHETQRWAPLSLGFGPAGGFQGAVEEDDGMDLDL